jgi:hypothetical protein
MKKVTLRGAQTSCSPQDESVWCADLWGTRPSWLRGSMDRRDARSPHRLEACAIIALALLISFGLGPVYAQNEPILVPDAVDYSKLLPVLPDAPEGWTADKAEGSTEDVGGFRITNVHRDYRKGEGDKTPIAAVSILDSAANPDYVTATIEAWHNASETSEGYSKSVTIDGNPGFETFENESKHATLWVMIANRYFLQIELQEQEPKQLQEWVKRIDLKKLAAIK